MAKQDSQILFDSPHYQRLCDFLWAAAIIALPVSSVPVLTRFSNATSVGPASTVFLVVLAVIWLFPFLWQWIRKPAGSTMRRHLPATISRLFWFLWVVGISWALAILFLEAPPFRGQTPSSLALSAFLTVGLGISVFFTAAAWLATHPQVLKKTLRMIHYGGIIVLAWSMVQAYFVLLHGNQYPDLLYKIQGIISASPAGLYVGRVTGMAFEPSWLGHQLNIVYLPMWFAYTITGQSSFRRLGPLSLENVLLLLGAVVLLVSFSRIGWISFALVILVSAMVAAFRIATYLRARWFSKTPSTVHRMAGFVLPPILIAGMVLLLGLVGAASFRFGVLIEPRLALILENNPFEASSLYDFANRLFFGERMVYWATGLSVFEKYPLFGVGLGNVGLYFPQNLPGFGYWLPEVANLLYRLSVTMNTKSLWVRLLAETGLVGFSTFFYWFLSLARAGYTAWHSPDRDVQVVGISGLCMLVAMLAEGFSIDSFALPYFWFMAAMLTAAAARVNRLPA